MSRYFGQNLTIRVNHLCQEIFRALWKCFSCLLEHYLLLTNFVYNNFWNSLFSEIQHNFCQPSITSIHKI